jgi:hypothetical protein
MQVIPSSSLWALLQLSRQMEVKDHNSRGVTQCNIEYGEVGLFTVLASFTVL